MSNRQGVWSLSAHLQAIADTDWTMAPGAPTGVSATAGNAQATVAFSAPSFTGIPAGITGFKVTSSEGETATGSSSPLTVTGLTNGTSYTFSVQAQNAIGFGAASSNSSSVSPAAPIGMFFGGESSSNRLDTVNKVTLGTTGNAVDYGNLTAALHSAAGLASTTRAITTGGSEASANNEINYKNWSSDGNFFDYGNLNVGRQGHGGCGSSTRGVSMMGESGEESIEYITLASTGNGTDFGDSSLAGGEATSCSSDTRGIAFRAGYLGGSYTNTIEYITIANTGNTSDFGDMLNGMLAIGVAASNKTRGIHFGGYYYNPTEKVNVIQYITIASAGNATDFGNLAGVTFFGGACAGETRALRAGGDNRSNEISYVTIASTGNSTDFGDLTYSLARRCGGTSSNHGGLQ